MEQTLAEAVDEDAAPGEDLPSPSEPGVDGERDAADTDDAGDADDATAAADADDAASAADPAGVPGPEKERTVLGTGPAGADDDPSVFRVKLTEFEGPFDLLLSLISKHKLDVTTLALSQVTDDFIAFIRAQGADWDLDAASEFLLIAATLLDLKAARLLPAAEVEDEEDLALLEARDLLFARLLQYRAYKQVAAVLADRYAHASLRHPRSVPLDAEFCDLLPELVLALSPERFAQLAVRAMTPKIPPTVSIAHIHQIQVSVREQASVIVEKLRELRVTTFQVLVADAPDTLHVVARFLALLELFRERAVGFDQDQEVAYAELTVRWTGDDVGDIDVDGEYDEGDGVRPLPTPRDGDEADEDGDDDADRGDDGYGDDEEESDQEDES